jgi:hypothetical protein
MKTRIAAVASVAILTVGLAAAPAEAGTFEGCPINSFCLYQALGYAQNRWTTSLNNIYQHDTNGITSCMNIAPATWPNNGGAINDNSAGVVNNNAEGLPWTGFDTYVFNWTNCNPDGGYQYFPGTTAGISGYGDLRPIYYTGGCGCTEYHAYTSIELIVHAS